MNLKRFENKTVLVTDVTGVTGALGSGLVRRFAAEEANVVIGARRPEQVADLVGEIGVDRAPCSRRST